MKQKLANLLLLSLSILWIFSGCKSDTSSAVSERKMIRHEVPQQVKSKEFGFPVWAKNANIYEVNLRQYTKEGTFTSFLSHIPRLKKMGVDILWFMPIYPISEAKRKGSLGSYYAVSDYKAVNPEFGNIGDCKSMIDSIHRAGMKIIIDWVPNHTGWDHAWITEHPEWYTQDKDGNIIDPIDPGTGESWGWTDVADLNYDNPEMRKEMIKDMVFWVEQMQVDGFRQDVAHNVPTEFWREVKATFSKYKPLFLLAEAEIPEHRNESLFIASYGWSFHHLINEIASGEKSASAISKWYEEDRKKFNRGFHMHFTSNHDENTWSGTEYERMGPAVKTLAVLAATFDGIPLIYSGQEEPLKKRLEFFEKDEIPWNNYKLEPFYKTLLDLKHRNKALWNGSFGVEPEILYNDEQSIIYRKENDGHEVIAILNLSDQIAQVALPVDFDNMTEVFYERIFDQKKGQLLRLEPYGYRLFTNF